LFYGNSPDSEDRRRFRRAWGFLAFAFGITLILVLRLFQLQVLHGRDYFLIAELTRLNKVVIEAPRGSILDRNGAVLAENGLSYSITVDPLEGDKVEKSAPLLASLIGMPPDEVGERIHEIRKKFHTPAKLFKNADFRLFSIVEEHKSEFPGFGSVIEQRRNYPYGRVAGHVIGYMGELTQSEFASIGKSRGYFYGQSMGRDGIEQYCEDRLKGKNGTKFQAKNYLNRVMEMKHSEQIKPDPPNPGNSLRLTIDIRLQIAAEKAFGDTIPGALVAIDPRNGEILAMVSLPSFDPNEFTRVMTAAEYDSLVNDPDKPLFNRAIQATYPPGSTFKMLTALAGLENGFSKDTRFSPCHGSYTFGGRPFKCWKAGGHGSLDMPGAIANSCNVYFYQLGKSVGIENWEKTGEILGFGKRTGVDLFDEVPGRLPSKEYYKKTRQYYAPGTMLNLAIGQGENDVTVLQLACYAGIIATEGIKAPPHFDMANAAKPERVAGISRESFQVVKEGMLRVVTEGTARGAGVPGHLVAGKTGTAQNPHGADHKIFVGFAPFGDPTVAIACVAENAGDQTPSRAVTVARRFLEEYFAHYPDKSAAIP
jgi:penicillin-binding protein 2